MQKGRIQPNFWFLMDEADFNEISLRCRAAMAAKSSVYLDVAADAVIREIDRHAILCTGGFND